MWLFKHKRGLFFLAESSRHKSIVRTIGQKESCRGGRLVTAPWCPFMLQRKSQTTNQPTNNNKKHETSKQQQQPNQRPHILPETIVHLGARRRHTLFFYLFIFCCCSSCNTFKTDSSRFSLVGVYTADKEKSPANGGW